MLHHTLRDHFEAYLKELAPQLGHADRVSSFKDYCYGLMLPLPIVRISRQAAVISEPICAWCRFR